MNGSGQATCTIATGTYSAAGAHPITAQYLGSTNYAASAVSSTLTQNVDNATITTVVSSANPSVVGQAIAYQATVTSSPSNPTTGNVEFFDGVNPITGCTSVAVNAAGVATCTIAAGVYSSTGSHTITAQYLGTAGWPASAASSAVTQTVNAAGTTTTVASSP